MELVAALTVTSDNEFLWYGRRATTVAAAGPESVDGHGLVSALALHLYVAFYCAGGATPWPSTPQDRPTPAYTRALRRAGGAGETWMNGWRMTPASNATGVGVVHDGIMWWARSDAVTLGRRAKPQLDEPVEVRVPSERVAISPGFYGLVGRCGSPSPPIIRFYWNVRALGGPKLISVLRESLNEAAIGFTLKILKSPGAFVRADAAVLYVAEADCDAASRVIRRVYPRVSEYLKPPVPALTLKLAAGLGFAEDPPGGESFGQHRCGLISEALIDAYHRGLSTPRERVKVVREHFSAAAVEVESPYTTKGMRRRAWRRLRIRGALVIDPLKTAGELGLSLANTAVWYRSRCTWVGPEPTEDARGTIGWIHRPLGYDFYSGTAGVALFLAELARLSDSRQLRRVASGAIIHALAGAAGETDLARRGGLYTGILGVAVAAALVGRALDDGSLTDRGLALARRAIKRDEPAHTFDVIAGEAGRILGYLALADMAGGDDVLLAASVRLGERLLDTAIGEGLDAIAWSTVGPRRGPRLTGFSHGTAGAGYAFFALWSRCRDDRWLRAGEQAFAYEMRTFDPSLGNWADLRASWRRPTSTPTHESFWCHGAGGIGLLRMIAYALTGRAT